MKSIVTSCALIVGTLYACLCTGMPVAATEPVLSDSIAPSSNSPSTRPNIVIILADDLGVGDVSVLNPDSTIPTPHLNQMAREGMIFSDAHANSAVCTPTRYGLLTGRYCWRSRLKSSVLFPPTDNPLIENDRPTIASFLKSHGYQTAMVGKWHLGIGWHKDQAGKVDFDQPIDNGPNEKGFDQWFGVAASLDMIPYGFIRDHQLTQPANRKQQVSGFPRYLRAGPKTKNFQFGDVLDTLVKESVDFINVSTNKGSPFFLYLPLTSPHKPVWPHTRFSGVTTLGSYGDFVHQTDHTIGQVLAALEENKVANNTLVIITSDNGSFMKQIDIGQPDHTQNPSVEGYLATRHRANGIWRGTKTDIWEGGHRVPFFVRWPEVVERGTRTGRVTSMTDIFSTIADVIAEDLPDGAAEDSASFLPALTRSESSPRGPIILHASNGTFAIRDGPWKLVLGNGSGGREIPKGKPFRRPYFLANLLLDPAETTNVLKSNAEMAADLEKKFKAIAGDFRQSR